MNPKIVLTIIFIAIVFATCSTLTQTRNLDVKTNSKKVVIKGDADNININIYQDTLHIDTL